MTTFLIHAIPAPVLAAMRTTGRASDSTARVVADGGEPVRCCLRDAAPGEPLLLVNYEPPLPESPYREVGAVFIHADSCAASPLSVDEYPAAWSERPQVLRAYDDRGWIHPATTVHDGTDPTAAIRAVLAEPGVVQVHSRNIAYGCYMFSATRCV